MEKEKKQQYTIEQALQRMGIDSLNEMQQAALQADARRDLLLLSPTGSGKTLAFLLPLLAHLQAKEQVQAVVITPSRELALQIDTVFRKLRTGLKVTCCYGGHPFQTERRSLEHPPVLWIGTPGRILDHLEKESLDPQFIHTVVLDEFDKSLELKFLPEMKQILARLKGVKRRILTSATNSIEIPAFVGMHNPLRLLFREGSKQPKRLQLYQVQSPQKDKLETLYRLLGELNGESTLVFCNHRESVERVVDYLKKHHVSCASFHGGMEQPDREQTLALLRNGSINVFISTDLASRGLDIPEVRHVIHYHLPLNQEAFIHRNGRTARMQSEGAAYLLLHEAETVPEYIHPEPKEFFLPKEPHQPKQPDWETLTINRGKRDKLSKKDIAGFLYQKGKLTQEDVGMIEVFESCALVAVRRGQKASLLRKIQPEKIKNTRAKYW